MRLVLVLLLPLFLFASKALVELDIDRGQEFFVSKKFNATLKVKTTAFSISDLDVNLGENSDFVIVEPSSAAYISSEEIGDERYQFSVYEYGLYPLKANALSLKPFKVNFSVSSGYGQPKEHFSLETSQKELFISSPKGAKGFVLATPDLSVKTSFSDNKKSYKVGDAITQTLTIIALDVPDVLIRKVAFSEIDGFKRYENESRLSQEKKDKSLISKRTQSCTYIFKQDGNYTIPAQTIEWYNTQTFKLMSASTKAYSFEVIGEVLEESSAKEKVALQKSLYIAFGIVLFILLFSYSLFRYKRRKNKNRYALEKRINPIDN
ncbi:MAG: hypothetical protein U9N52_06955 [Campylobacterota bacterium]|nr:hypothetical protein [Campylobacterota bacterium]